MQTLRTIGIVGRLTLLASARRQVFHVLLLAALCLFGGAVALSRFDAVVHRKLLADLCLGVIYLISSLITVTIAVAVLPGEMEDRTLTPILAKPVLRWQYLLGKYVGIMGVVGIAMGVMAAVFALLEYALFGHADAALLLVVPYLFLAACILGALALWLSLLLSWPMAWFLALLICLLGNVRAPLYAHLMAQPQSGFNRATISLLNALLPDLASFDFQDALVHHIHVPAAALAQAAAYAVCYIWAVLILAMYTFARKEL